MYGISIVVMSSDFLDKEQIIKDLKDDLGKEVWAGLDVTTQDRLVNLKTENIRKKYSGIDAMIKRIDDVRKNQAQLYLGILFGLSSGLLGAVVDRVFEKSLLYNSFVVLFFVVMVLVVHHAYNTLVKNIYDYAKLSELEKGELQIQSDINSSKKQEP
jgi:cbb3-type cytochrome oxidase subunit 3